MKYPLISERRTRIICTIGPAVKTMDMLERMIRSGMNIARLNLSHGTHKDHARYIESVRKVSRRLNKDVAILMDLPGPKYRVGKLKGGRLTLRKGSIVVLTTRVVVGDTSVIPVNLPTLPRDVRRGNVILLDDGAIQLRVLSRESTEVKCKVLAGNVLTDGRGLVVPGMKVSGPFVTASLEKHLLFALKQKPDFLALSFVSRPDEINQVRDILVKNGADIPIISKIERGDAVKRFDKILAVSDGIMVARGDLGVDIPLESLPIVQKEIIAKCNRAGKPVITATQMLESMITTARPTRAEVTDVANAIFDGTDATMLSGETSVGKYPSEAVRIMDRVAREAETSLPYDQMLLSKISWLPGETDEIISYNACHTAHRLGAVAIVALTESGSTARRLSRYRPGVPVVAITPHKDVCQRLLLYWGIYSVRVEGFSSIDNMFVTAARICKGLGLGKAGDLIVVTAGIPIGTVGSTNLLKVQEIS